MSDEKIKPAIICGREVKVGDEMEGVKAWGGCRHSSGSSDDTGVVKEITRTEIILDTPRGRVFAQRAIVCDAEPMNVGPSGCTECLKETDRLTTVAEMPGKRFCSDCWDARQKKHPKVVVICGSSRFIDVMAVCGWLLERDEGAIVMGLHLLPYWYSEEAIPNHLAEHEGVADQMDELHLRKMDLGLLAREYSGSRVEVFVVNVKHYIGDSTTREVEYAKENGIPIRWYTDDVIGEKVNRLLEEFIERSEKVEFDAKTKVTPKDGGES